MGTSSLNPAAAPSVLAVEFAQASDRGRVRGNNEDYLGYFQPSTPAQTQAHGWLFAVADGVGGQELGEVASRAAVESLLANFRDSPGAESQTSLLRRLIQAANHEVYELGRSAAPGGVTMATTIVACALRCDAAVVAHVGDSRCYLIRGGRATALTRDHSVAAEHVRLGILSEKQGAESANRHLLSRALGVDLFVSVDIASHTVLPGDVLLLCTDGFYNSVDESDLVRHLVPDADLAAATHDLVAVANERDSGDNISVQVIRIASVERTGMYRGRRYRLR